MIVKNNISPNGNLFTYHDMLSRVRFLATEIALGTDKLLNDLFIRESINNAIVDIYGRLYEKIKYNYLSIATLTIDEPISNYTPIVPINYMMQGTTPFKYGVVTIDNLDMSNTIQEILTMNMPQFSHVQSMQPEMFENIANTFNTTYLQSCGYISYPNYFELFVGEKLWDKFISDAPQIRMSYIRRPVLDDLKKVHPDIKYTYTIVGNELSYFSETYHQSMDIPSEYNRLIEVMVMKDIYNGLGQPMPENYDNILVSIIQQMIGVPNAESNSSVPSRTE